MPARNRSKSFRAAPLQLKQQHKDLELEVGDPSPPPRLVPTTQCRAVWELGFVACSCSRGELQMGFIQTSRKLVRSNVCSSFSSVGNLAKPSKLFSRSRLRSDALLRILHILRNRPRILHLLAFMLIVCGLSRLSAKTTKWKGEEFGVVEFLKQA